MTLMTRVRGQDMFDLLGGESEQEQPDKKFEVKPNTALEEIVRGFEQALEIPSFVFAHSFAAKIHDRITVRAEDIEKFSLICPSYGQDDIFDTILQHYLNDLIKGCKDNSFTVHTARLKTPPNNLCTYNLGKHITIHGNVGKYLGKEMISGRIHVYGNADE